MKKKTPSEQEVINNVVLGSSDPINNPPDPKEAKSVKKPENEEQKAEDIDLAKAFVPDRSNKKPKTSRIVFFIIGLTTLVTGLVILIKTLTSVPATVDADYLVKVGQWQRSDEESVIWDFTEVGKGTLTTNNHTNDYDFIWAIEDGKLQIETDWLYTMNDEYHYQLDQSKNVLTLLDDQGEVLYTFIPTEASED